MLLLERDQPEIYDETGGLLASVPDPNGDAWLVHLLICDILLRMQPEECWLIRQRFSPGRAQTEIAHSLGLNSSSISRKEKAARQHFLAAWNK